MCGNSFDKYREDNRKEIVNLDIVLSLIFNCKISFGWIRLSLYWFYWIFYSNASVFFTNRSFSVTMLICIICLNRNLRTCSFGFKKYLRFLIYNFELSSSIPLKFNLGKYSTGLSTISFFSFYLSRYCCESLYDTVFLYIADFSSLSTLHFIELLHRVFYILKFSKICLFMKTCWYFVAFLGMFIKMLCFYPEFFLQNPLKRCAGRRKE